MKKFLMITSLVLAAQIATAGTSNKSRTLSSSDPALSHSKKIDCPYRASGSAFDKSSIKPHGKNASTHTQESATFGTAQ